MEPTQDPFEKFPFDILFQEFLHLHKEEELIRLAWRARKTRQYHLHNLVMGEIKSRGLGSD